MGSSYDYVALKKMEKAYALTTKSLFGNGHPDEECKEIIARSLLSLALDGDQTPEQMAVVATSRVRLLLDNRLRDRPASGGCATDASAARSS